MASVVTTGEGPAASTSGRGESSGSLSYSNVLFELLVALLGHTGDVFVETPSADPVAPWECNLRLSPEVRIVSEPDRKIIDELVELGFHARHIGAFAAKEATPLLAGSVSSASMYRRALGAGLTEVMDVYRAAILQVEQHVLNEAHTVAGTIHHFLSDFGAVFPTLHNIVYVVLERRPSGPRLLDLLYSKAHCGIPPLQSCIMRLLWHCHQVMYKQLTAWMVYGQQLEGHADFFIAGKQALTIGSASGGLIKQRLSRRTLSAPSSPVGRQNSGEGTQHSGEKSEGGNGAGAEELRAHEEWMETVVLPERLPTYISWASAERLNFVGNAVRVLRAPKGDFRGRELLPHSDTVGFAEALRQLAAQPVFSKLAFERTGESIGTRVASHLWDLMVVKAELPRHLQALRNYFLLADGDLWHQFLTDARPTMAHGPGLGARGTTAVAAMSSFLSGAAAKTGADQDRCFGLLSIEFDEGPNGASVPMSATPGSYKFAHLPKYDDWDALSLSYEVSWPLHLFFTTEVMAQYRCLFRFMLQLKRVHLALEGVWRTVTSWSKRLQAWKLQHLGADAFDRKAHGADTAALDSALCCLATQLLHRASGVATNLLYYMQVDVIQPGFEALQERIAASHDFSEARAAHAAFLDRVLTQSFLPYASIKDDMDAMFAAIRDLCTYVHQVNDECLRAEMTGAAGSARPALSGPRLRAILSKFTAAQRNWYVDLQSRKLQEVAGTAPSLRQLFLRLNFNDFLHAEVRKTLGYGAGGRARA